MHADDYDEDDDYDVDDYYDDDYDVHGYYDDDGDDDGDGEPAINFAAVTLPTFQLFGCGMSSWLLNDCWPSPLCTMSIGQTGDDEMMMMIMMMMMTMTMMMAKMMMMTMMMTMMMMTCDFEGCTAVETALK